MAATHYTTTITIEPVAEPTALYCHYDRQSAPQDAFIALDLERAELWAGYDAEIGNAIPARAWHGILRRWRIAPLQASAANALMAEIAPLAQRVLAGASIEWDGHNHVARLDGDAELAAYEIDRLCENYSSNPDNLVHWADADNWLGDYEPTIRARLEAGESVESLIADLDGTGLTEDSPIVEGIERYIEALAREISLQS